MRITSSRMEHALEKCIADGSCPDAEADGQAGSAAARTSLAGARAAIAGAHPARRSHDGGSADRSAGHAGRRQFDGTLPRRPAPAIQAVSAGRPGLPAHPATGTSPGVRLSGTMSRAAAMEWRAAATAWPVQPDADAHARTGLGLSGGRVPAGTRAHPAAWTAAPSPPPRCRRPSRRWCARRGTAPARPHPSADLRNGAGPTPSLSSHQLPYQPPDGLRLRCTPSN